MNLESDKRLKFQLRLDFSSAPTGEARQALREDMNRSRRAIGHTGDMSEHAVARMELLVREWLIVVG